MNPVEIILDAVENIRNAIQGDAGPMDVIDAVKPLLLKYAQSEAVFTDARREAIQSEVLNALYSAGLVPTADLGGSE